MWDSHKELQYYLDLKLRKRAGDIKDFAIKPKIVLQPSFKFEGKTIREIAIYPDFLITHGDGSLEYVDTKGMITELWKMKWKMFKYQQRDSNIKFTIVWTHNFQFQKTS